MTSSSGPRQCQITNNVLAGYRRIYGVTEKNAVKMELVKKCSKDMCWAVKRIYDTNVAEFLGSQKLCGKMTIHSEE